MGEFFVSNHPLIQNKMAMLRNKNTCTKEFKEIISEVAMLLCYEATRHIELVPAKVETPIAEADVNVINRALPSCPYSAREWVCLTGFLRLCRRPKSVSSAFTVTPRHLSPWNITASCPTASKIWRCSSPTPCFATGGTAVAGIDFIKEKGAKR